MSNLSDRIALILQSEPASEAVAQIIAEARDELQQMDRQYAEAKAIVLDPLAGSAAVTKARREAEDLSLMRERLTVALEHLDRSLNAARTREEGDRRTVIYQAVKARRDAMIADLREHYPRLAGDLVSLLQRLQAVETEVAALEYPADVERFRSVEADARELPADWHIDGLVRRLAAVVRLPAFNAEDEYRERRLWPPRPVPIEFKPILPASVQVASDAA